MITSTQAARALTFMAEQLDLPDELMDAVSEDDAFLSNAAETITALDEAGRLSLFHAQVAEFSRLVPDGAAIAAEAVAQARRTRGDAAQLILELADYLPLLLVIAAFKLKLSIRVGRHFAADAELSLKADLPRLRKVISDQLPPSDP